MSITDRFSLSQRQGTVVDSARNWSIITVLLVISAWFSIVVIERIAGMHELANHPTPYFIAQHFLLLNVMGPLAGLAISLFFLWPGLLLASSLGRTPDLIGWLLKGFAYSLAVLCIPAIIFHQATGNVLRGSEYFVFVAGINLLALALFWFKANRGTAQTPDLNDHNLELGAAALSGVLVLMLMSAKFYWENFSSDGAGVLNFVRVFVNTDWPFWPVDSGAIQVAPGVTSYLFVLPGSWFQRLLGETEIATRLPYVLYIGLLYAVVVGMIRSAREWRPHLIDHALILAAFMIYTLSIIYSGGYNPYFGDSPMPAARETLVLALFMAFIHLTITNQMGLAFVVGLLSYMILPTGGLWILLTSAAFFVVWRPLDWRRLSILALLMVICATLGIFGPFVFRAFDLPVPGSEFGVRGIVNRLRYITFWEPNRLVYLIVPAGILPVISMVFWKTQDRLARMLSLITAVFFLFFYFQGFRVLMHHFIPVMIPPLVVMWRYQVFTDPSRFLASRAVIALGLAAAFWLAFPAKPGLHSFSREIGAQVELRGDRYEGYQTRALGTFHEVFGHLFPIQYSESGANANYFGGPMVWLHYAVQPKSADQNITYILQPKSEPVPDDNVVFETYDGYNLLITDEAQHQANLETTFTTHFGAPVYQLSRDEIFGRGARRGERFVIDLVAIARNILGIEKPAK